MMTLCIAAGWLELLAGTVTLELSNPCFAEGQVPGTISYPFALAMSPANLRRLAFPHLRAAQGEEIAPEFCQVYVDGLLYRVGSLVYLGCDEQAQRFEYQLLCDAADLQARLQGLTLPDLDLGWVPLQLVPDAADYALPCLRNSLFYDKEQVAAYAGVVNYYRLGSYVLAPGGKRAPIVPFLRVVPLLRRVFEAVGWTVSGPWLASTEAQQLVLYCDRAAEDAQGNLPARLVLNRHVPALGVSEFVLGLQQLLGLAYDFHPVRPELRIATLAGVATDPAYVLRTGGPAKTTAVTDRGFGLEMGLESDDELNKTLDTSWAKLTVGAGKTARVTAAGTLHVVREADPLAPGRQWVVPAVEAKGASPAFDNGDDSRCGLRLLYDRGLQPDSEGFTYPLATWDCRNYAGQLVGKSTLRWAGPRGLYATHHQAWLALLDRAATREATMQLDVAGLLALSPARKELVEGRKYLWERVSVQLATTGRQPLGQAAFTYRYVRL